MAMAYSIVCIMGRSRQETFTRQILVEQPAKFYIVIYQEDCIHSGVVGLMFVMQQCT
jgi:hypothetical protein